MPSKWTDSSAMAALKGACPRSKICTDPASRSTRSILIAMLTLANSISCWRNATASAVSDGPGKKKPGCVVAKEQEAGREG